MQLAVFRKISFVFLSLGLLIPLAPLNAGDNPTTPPDLRVKSVFTISWTPTSAITALGILSALYLYANLQMKKTQPKRVYPKDDSFEEQFKFIHDEILVGQRCLPERLSGEHEDPLDSTHKIYEYSKVEARGLAGISEVYLQKTIIPTILLAVAFNTLKWNIKENWFEILTWINTPQNVVGHVYTDKPKS